MRKLGDRVYEEHKWNTGYNYWDTPDGQDCFKKMWFTTKYGTAAGLVMSFYDITLSSHPKGYFNGLARVAYFTVPAVSVGITFSALACTLTQFRNKDDELNYLLSGFCAGTVWGAARQNVGIGIRAGGLFAFVAFLLKIANVEQWDLFPKPALMEHGTYNQYKFDFTFRKDPKDSEH